MISLRQMIEVHLPFLYFTHVDLIDISDTLLGSENTSIEFCFGT